jgi:integrase
VTYQLAPCLNRKNNVVANSRPGDDRLAFKSRRQADYAWAVLARILAVALDRGWVDTIHASGEGVYIGRLYTGSRRDKIWVLDEELAFLERAPKHLHLPLTLALWTGQRQGDLLKLAWSAYDGTHIRLKQSKTKGLQESRHRRRDLQTIFAERQ